MRIRYSPRATRDLILTHKYLFERSPSGCANVMAAIHAAIDHIRDVPQAAEATNMRAVRVKTVLRYRFRIFYRVLPNHDVIEIIHIRHTSRRPWSEQGH